MSQCLHSIQGGFSAQGALTPHGWKVAALCMDNLDDEFGVLGYRHANTHEFSMKGDTSEWSRRLQNMKPRLTLVTANEDAVEESTLAEADRIEGPVINTEGDVAWCEKQSGTWRLMLHQENDENDKHVVFSHQEVLRSPAIARLAGETLLAVEIGPHAQPQTRLLKKDGSEITRFDGRSGKLAELVDGTALLVREQIKDRNKTCLKAERIDPRGRNESLFVPVADDLSEAISVSVAPDGTTYLSCNTFSTPGLNECVGLHRDIRVYSLVPGAKEFSPAPGTFAGLLPLNREGFWDRSVQNFTTVSPRITIADNTPCITWRCWRLYGHKSFGWDVWLSRLVDGKWTAPRRVSPDVGHADSDYALLYGNENWLGVFPSCDHEPRAPLEKFAYAKEIPPNYYCAAPYNERVDIHRLKEEDLRAPEALPRGRKAPYTLPPHISDNAPDPMLPESCPDNMTLLWGDTHVHTTMSKCMAANDGTLVDNLRYQRDVLGNQVLFLADHIEHLSAREFHHSLDVLEREAGEDCIPIYGAEVGTNCSHHTNIYAHNREVFLRLREIMLASFDRVSLYRRIKQEFAPDEVLPLRHYHGNAHGPFGTNGDRVTVTWDPELEVAMEAMQTRGNMMFEAQGGKPRFPVNFLNNGATIGLIGGSDHSRGSGINRFCLTGFWVREFSAEGVFHAIRNRLTLATSNGKVAIWATCNDQPMGTEIECSGAVKIKAEITAPKPVANACLMRDGEVLPWQPVDAEHKKIELVDTEPERGPHWYSVTLTGEPSAGRRDVLAHTSPFFVNVV